ncbi:MAG: pyruvate flavodoxin/ferredoxin oxidoreductase [Pseudomonadota bacterium]
MPLTFMDGNEATARAAFGAGCRFYAGYPITPAGGISDWMLKLLPPAGGVFLQGEDEIAGIGHCLGAAMAGEKVMTATSGPGISMISEQISFAAGSEIPIVIVNVQRLGPSTGSPTRGADGDIQFMRWSSSGGLPVIVLSPSHVIDCYTLTYHAFNLAERFRCPVFIASNKEVGTTQESFDLSAVRIPKVLSRRLAAADRMYLPFSVSPGEGVPAFLPIGGKTLVRQTSSTHGPDGYITASPSVISESRKRLNGKIKAASSEGIFYEDLPLAGADTLLIAYGVTARAAGVAVSELARDGYPVSLLVPKMLFPVLGAQIRHSASGARRVIVVEMNLGQYVREIERVLPDKTVSFFGQMNGELITPAQIKKVIADV